VGWHEPNPEAGDGVEAIQFRHKAAPPEVLFRSRYPIAGTSQ
jgi:hypothetical protein